MSSKAIFGFFFLFVDLASTVAFSDAIGHKGFGPVAEINLLFGKPVPSFLNERKLVRDQVLVMSQFEAALLCIRDDGPVFGFIRLFTEVPFCLDLDRFTGFDLECFELAGAFMEGTDKFITLAVDAVTVLVDVALSWGAAIFPCVSS